MALPGITKQREVARAADTAALNAWRVFGLEVAGAREYPGYADLQALDSLLEDVLVLRRIAKREWDEVAFMEET